MLNEFKKFALKGNIIDLAVGVIIGGAFGKIVTSLVNDLLMPILGIIVGGINFSDLTYVFGDDVEIKYGLFLQSLIDFFIIAFSIFIFIKLLSKFKKKDEDVLTKTISNEEKLLTEIRDLLKEK